MLAVDSCTESCVVAMEVIDGDECGRFVLYLRFYGRLQLHVKAPACWLVSYRTLACRC